MTSHDKMSFKKGTIFCFQQMEVEYHNLLASHGRFGEKLDKNEQKRRNLESRIQNLRFEIQDNPQTTCMNCQDTQGSEQSICNKKNSFGR